MKKEVLALEIEIQHGGNSTAAFSFNDSMLRTIATRLKTVSNEVFIWRTSNHIAVWVVGATTDFVVDVFEHYQSHYIKMQLLDHEEAEKLFKNILEDNIWYNTSMALRFETFMHAYKLALEVQGLGPTLYPSIRETLNFFNNAPLITASRNAWTASSQTKKRDMVKVKSNDLFYRFGIN